MTVKRLLLGVSLLIFVFGLSGCFKGEQAMEEIDIPEDISVIDESELEEEPEESEIEVSETDQMIERTLYVLDADGLVVPQTFEIPKTAGAAFQALQYLVKDGPVTELLPNGFQAVLPAGTEILGTNLTDEGTLTIDVSAEFKEYEAQDEVPMLEAITHTMTQFDEVEKIKLRIEGEDQAAMPVNGTPIENGYSKNNGINIFVDEQPSLKENKMVTFFYPKQHNENTYFVPVSTFINETDEVHEKTVATLLKGAPYEFGALQVFNDDVSLADKAVLQDGVLQLMFNESILKSKDEPVIADEVMETLVRSLTEKGMIDAIDVQVENVQTIENEAGEVYAEPVQVSDFGTMEKM
ncbi:MAG TPA: GerMN domain-containing protein [Pseudogracilibacillus sp.]|nr:GerMN domain-containing protein [Pseudogracilibacillus sp.]